MSNPFNRRHIRFLTKAQVEIRTPSRDDFKTLWTKDISKGGLFVETDDPPALRTQIEVRLMTTEGMVSLRAEVVHVLDAQTAQQMGHPPGAGLQFVNVEPQIKKQIEQYIDGTQQRLDRSLVTISGVESTKDLLQTAKEVLNAINESKLYAALQATPEASAEELLSLAETLKGRLEKPPKGITPPQAARLDSVARQVGRIAALLTDPQRRLHYDFRHGHIQAEARIEAAEKGDPSVEELRKQWEVLFPERVNEAKEKAKAALMCQQEDNHAGAIEAAEEALALDPFNQPLRETITEWRQKKK